MNSVSLKNRTKPFALHSHDSLTSFKTWLKFFQEARLIPYHIYTVQMALPRSGLSVIL